MTLIISAVLVPIVIAGVCVWAGWQSSSRLHHGQGVVVNLDEPVRNGSTVQALGNQLSAQLVDLSGPDFQWIFGTSTSDAESGLASGRYSVAVVIPDNFSQTLLAKDGQRSVLTLQTSPVANEDQKSIASSLAQAAQRGLARQLGNAALDNVYVTFGQLDKDLVTASTNAQGAASSAVALNVGLTQATTQTSEVAAVTKQVSQNSNTVANDAQVANQQVVQNSTAGTAGAAAAVAAVVVAKAHAGVAAGAAAQTGSVSSALSAAKANATTANAAIAQQAQTARQLAASATSLGNTASAAGQQAAAWQQTINAAVAAQGQLSAQLQGVQSGATQTTTQLATLTGKLQQGTTVSLSGNQQAKAQLASAAQSLRTQAAANRATAQAIRQLKSGGAANTQAVSEALNTLLTWTTGSIPAPVITGTACPEELLTSAASEHIPPGQLKQFCEVVYVAGLKAGFDAGYARAQTNVRPMVQAAKSALASIGGSAGPVQGAEALAQQNEVVATQLTSLAGQFTQLAAGLPTSTTAPTDPQVLSLLSQVSASAGGVSQNLTSVVAQSQRNSQAVAGLPNVPSAQQLTTSLHGITSAAQQQNQQVAAISSQLGAVSSGLAKLSASVQQASNQASGVTRQAQTTSSGAANLASQLVSLQQQLAAASNQGGGTAAQTTKVANNAQQLSQQAGTAASAASGLAGTMKQVGSAGQAVGSQTKTTADQVKHTSTTASQQTNSQPVTGTLTTTRSESTAHPNVQWVTPLLALAMWLGAMAMYLLFRPITAAARASSASPWQLVWSLLALGLAVGAIQAVTMTVLAAALMKLNAVETLAIGGALLLAGLANILVNFALAAGLGGVGRVISVLLAMVAGLSLVTNALPQTLDTLRAVSPVSPAVDAMRAAVTGADGFGASFDHLIWWALGGLVLSSLLVLRARVAAPVLKTTQPA